MAPTGRPSRALFDLRNRIAGSDPGGNRLHQAMSAGLAVASALAVEFGFARLLGLPGQLSMIFMMLGAMIAMMGSMALTGTARLAKLRTAAFFPVALGAGMAAGAALAGVTALMLGGFVVVMFVAVFVRRFGLAFFFYGFMAWMGYFFASFLHATLAMVPLLLLPVAVASGWVLLLSVTVLQVNPRRVLRRTLRAFGARSRWVAAASAGLLEAAVTDTDQRARWHRRLAARRARLAEAALMIEGWSAEPRAVPAGWSAATLRRHLLDAHLAVDGVATAAETLAAGADTQLVVESARLAGLLAQRDHVAARQAARDLLGRTDSELGTERDGWWPARQLAMAVAAYAALAARFDHPPEPGEPAEFEPAVTLAMGNLPGAPAFAREVRPRGRSWNPLTRLDFVSRQAMQAAVAGGIAILVGRELSTTRYYWAVIAAFVAFTGTATRSETFLKAVNRVLGTLAGIVAGLALAHLTGGHTLLALAVIVLSVSLGFYLVRISYRYMIFFITIMICQLYGLLHELSGGLLVTRLGETAIGGAVGAVVALVLAPLSTRDVFGTTQRTLLTELAALLHRAGDRLAGGTGTAEVDLDAAMRGLDHRLYQVELSAVPLLRPLVWGNRPSRVRHRLNLLRGLVRHARGLVAAVREPARSPVAGPAAACHALADAAESLVAHGDSAGSAVIALAAADTALLGQSGLSDPATRPPAAAALLHLAQLLRELTPAGHQPTGPTEVFGTVFAAGGGPVREARITVQCGDGGPAVAADTDEHGRYRITGLAAGTYRVVAAGYPPVRVPVRLLRGCRFLDLRLSHPAPPAADSGA